MDWYRRFPPYVSVTERKRKAEREVERLKKKGHAIQPIVLANRAITKTFWAKAWCRNLEAYSDFHNRLPRGRSYLRNGSVIDLKVSKGEVTALVCGSSIYKVRISISPVIDTLWNKIVADCAGKIDSLIELLQGKFSKAVMERMTHPENGLFPHPKEITLSCSCPDGAQMCKHVSAVLYGVGTRLDESPEELFLLRSADPVALIAKADSLSLVERAENQTKPIIEESDLSTLFGIDIQGLPQNPTHSAKAQASVKNHKVSFDLLKKSKVIRSRGNVIKKVRNVKLTSPLKKQAIKLKSKKMVANNNLKKIKKSSRKKITSNN